MKGKGAVFFHRRVQTRLQWEKLMAMINDKGPEESRDTDATYIILSHQSVHLPGPSWQRGGGVGRGSRGAGREGRKEERERASYLPPVLCTEELLFSSSRESRKRKNKWQRGDKVNKKMACKISGRYSVRAEESKQEGSRPWSLLISATWLSACRSHISKVLSAIWSVPFRWFIRRGKAHW